MPVRQVTSIPSYAPSGVKSGWDPEFRQPKTAIATGIVAAAPGAM
jgi:hypothetical protein